MSDIPDGVVLPKSEGANKPDFVPPAKGADK